MELQERLSAYLNYKRLKYRDFERICGLGNGTAASLSKKTRWRTFDRISYACPDLNIEWLKTGDGDMLVEVPDAPDAPAAGGDEKDATMVPLLNLDARGGFEMNAEVGRQYTDKLIAWNGARSGDFAVEVSGTSMMPQIPPGSRILLRQVEDWREYLEKNLPYVVELRDERRLLKVVLRSGLGDDYWDLMSYNADVPTEPLPVSLVRRVYKVVGTLVNYGF